ncbi:MAG: ATP-dependent metallopeptidase FtsH/Yme1/Tma family protein [Desulfobulbaceae bacterium]|uniref:ATP-dependent zinc metalloprotease FtsH n=1 Tax=Candidatus Desulfatifera sulfidica TaxID=2841691 RepID=A0A8J6NAX5_9BACT|nr:ATP-dependent metallopeptidase FtsH/Yme1/Tma family protein [Candidatus Desulfatifera sulfidica]
MSNIQIGLLMILLTFLGITGYNVWLRETTPPPMSYSDFLENLEGQKISSVHLKGGSIRGVDTSDRPFSTFSPDVGSLMPSLLAQSLEITSESNDPGIGQFLKSLIPVILILGGWLIFNRMQGKKNGSFAKSGGAHLIPQQTSNVTFEDVAGIGEALEELTEIVDSLKNPGRFSKLGGRIPKGVLLQGSPGTGKTLLARAIAGEAGVPFYSLGGSDFVEMFVGVGASRVRELFTEAKKNSPCIIFIDEIDAIGGKRSGGNASGSNDEREQTLNALLVEMDGFSSDKTVIIIAATNRPDILDAALLRPGRFDRQVTISLPDVKGRQKILAVHGRKVRLSRNVNFGELARSIPGFSGADIANLVNEAALMAARHDKTSIDMEDFDEAKDKIVMGLARKNVVISENDRRVTAYHEAGHAIVAKMLPDTDPVHKITIIPRGRAMGLTQQLPLVDRYTYSYEYLMNRIKTLMGGRIAEELIFGRLTTGASNDILGATEIATRMICEWGMNPEIGPVAHQQTSSGFLGEGSTSLGGSEQTAREIDSQIKKTIDECYAEARELLMTNNKFLHKLAEALLVNETVDAEEMDIVFHCYLNEKEYEKSLINKSQEV